MLCAYVFCVIFFKCYYKVKIINNKKFKDLMIMVAIIILYILQPGSLLDSCRVAAFLAFERVILQYPSCSPNLFSLHKPRCFSTFIEEQR